MLEEPNMSFLSFVKRQTYATKPRLPLISQQSSCVSLLHVEMAHVCPMTILPIFHCFLEAGSYSVPPLSQAGLELIMYPRLAILLPSWVLELWA